MPKTGTSQLTPAVIMLYNSLKAHLAIFAQISPREVYPLLNIRSKCQRQKRPLANSSILKAIVRQKITTKKQISWTIKTKWVAVISKIWRSIWIRRALVPFYNHLLAGKKARTRIKSRQRIIEANFSIPRWNVSMQRPKSNASWRTKPLTDSPVQVKATATAMQAAMARLLLIKSVKASWIGRRNVRLQTCPSSRQ